MAQIVDSWGVTWYVTDFKLKYDLEKPAQLTATVAIPDGDIIDSDIWSVSTATNQKYVHAFATHKNELYAGTRDDINGGRIFKFVNNEYWAEVYDGQLERLNPNCFVELGSYLYFGSTKNGKIYRTSDGTNWSLCFNGDGDKVHCMLAYSYSSTAYIMASIGNKIYRTTDGTTWTDVTPANFYQMPITCLVSFNSKLWALSSGYGYCPWYSSDNGATWTIRNMTNKAYYGFGFVFNSYFYLVGKKWYGNNDRIVKISTSDTETSVYAGDTGFIGNGLSYVTFDSCATVAMDNGKIISITTGDSVSELYDVGGNGYGTPYSLIVSTHLYVGTSTKKILKCTTSAHAWSVSETITENNIYCIKYWNSYFFTGVGNGGNDGKVYRSSSVTNLDSSTVYGTPESQIRSLYSWGGYLYAGTGTGGKILRSQDGSSWSLVYDSTSQYIFGFAVLGSDLYAVGSQNAAVYKTSNGVSWSLVYNPSMTYAFSIDVANLYGYTYLYITLYDGSVTYIRRSSDGSSWSTVYNASNFYFYKVKNINDSMIYVSDNAGRIFYSVNGDTGSWSNIYTSLPMVYDICCFDKCVYICGYGTNVYKSTSITSPSFSSIWTSPESYLTCLIQHRIHLYTGGYDGNQSGRIHEYSLSYLTKENKHNTDAYRINRMLQYNNYLYACGKTQANEGIIIRTANGQKWEEVFRGSTTTDVNSLCIFGTYLYAGTSSLGKIFRTFNGKDWTEAADLSEANIMGMIIHGSYIFALSSDTTNKAGVYRSSNGTSWTKVYTCSTAMYAWWAICSFGGYVYAGFSNGTTSSYVLVRSTDGASWSDCSSGLPSGALYLLDMYVFNSYIYLGIMTNYASYDKALLRSSSGTSWSAVTITTYTTASHVVTGFFSDSTYLYLTFDYSNIYYSSNGTSWTLLYDHTEHFFHSIYSIYQLYDNLYLFGYAFLYRPVSRIGKLVVKMKNADYYKFYMSSNNEYDKFVLTNIKIINESVMELTFYHWTIDLWKKFGYYLQGTNGFIDYTNESISAKTFLNNVVGSSCGSLFRIKYCPNIQINIKGEWLPRHQWLYETARLISFALNDNATYSSYHLKDSDSYSDIKVDHMNVVVANNGDIFIMPAGSTIYGTDPTYSGYYQKRITDITNNIWEADEINVNCIDYTNAIVLDGSGTGTQRRNYLASSIDITYSNNFSTSEKVKELSHIVTDPPWANSVLAETTQSYLAGSSALRMYMRILNTNYMVDAVLAAFHPTLVINNDNCILKTQVMNSSGLAQVTNRTYYKEAGFVFGGGDNQPSIYKSYRACVKEEWTSSAKNYYIKLYADGVEVSSATLTAVTDIDSLDSINNYLAVKWYTDGTTGLHTIKVFYSNSSMPDPSSATPKITFNTESKLPYSHGAVGLYSLVGNTATSTTPVQPTPTLYAYFTNLSITGETDSLWGENVITKPVIIIKDKSITTKAEARNVAITALQNALNPKQLTIRIDPSIHMWGTTGNRIWLGQWVLIDGKGYYDGEYRVMWMEITQDKMILGLNNTKYNFTEKMEQLRNQVDKIDTFG